MKKGMFTTKKQKAESVNACMSNTQAFTDWYFYFFICCITFVNFRAFRGQGVFLVAAMPR